VGAYSRTISSGMTAEHVHDGINTQIRLSDLPPAPAAACRWLADDQTSGSQSSICLPLEYGRSTG